MGDLHVLRALALRADGGGFHGWTLLNFGTSGIAGHSWSALAVGMKVKVTGRYDFARMFSTGMVRVPTTGVMAMEKMDVIEPAPAPAPFAKP